MTMTMTERDQLTHARRVVVKIGSRLLAESPAGRPAAIADQIAALRQRDVSVLIVSSGAIALGMRRLGLTSRPRELPALQAAAAVGQSRLMQHWEHAFAVHDLATRGAVRRLLARSSTITDAEAVDALDQAVETALAQKTGFLPRAVAAVEVQLSAEGNPFLDAALDAFDRRWRARVAAGVR